MARAGRGAARIAASSARTCGSSLCARARAASCGGASLGIALGLLIGRFALADDLLLPPLEVLRPIPGGRLDPARDPDVPVVEAAMVFITFIGALFPILLNTIHGVEGVDRRLVASARSLGARPLAPLPRGDPARRARPASSPGLAIGMGTAWFCLVTAEMIAGQYGIGYYTWESYTLQNYPDIVVGMLVIGVLGMGSSALVQARSARSLMPWYRAGGASDERRRSSAAAAGRIESRAAASRLGDGAAALRGACRTSTLDHRARRVRLPARAVGLRQVDPAGRARRPPAPARGSLARRRRSRCAGPHPERGLVFQQHTLFPGRRVIDNVAFGPKMQGVAARERRGRARELLALVGLAGFERRATRASCRAACSSGSRSPAC